MSPELLAAAVKEWSDASNAMEADPSSEAAITRWLNATEALHALAQDLRSEHPTSAVSPRPTSKD